MCFNKETIPETQEGYTVVEVLCALVILLVILLPLFASMNHYLNRLQQSDVQRMSRFLDDVESQLRNPTADVIVPRAGDILVETVRIDGRRYTKVTMPYTSASLYILE